MSEREYLDQQPAPEHEEVPDLIRKLREKRVAHRQRHVTIRVLYAAAGFTVTILGLAMFALPGLGATTVFPIGLAMLALEFAWAERVLHKAVTQALLAKQKAEEASRLEKILGVAAVVFAIAAFVTAAILWDIPVLPF